MTSKRLTISGRVQGVSYRAWFIDQARGLGLAGWVRNRSDGSVEAVVQGPAEAVDAIVAKAHEGSPASRVSNVIVIGDVPDERFDGFKQHPTC